MFSQLQLSDLEEKLGESEELEHELQEREAQLEKMTTERDRSVALARDLEQQLNKVSGSSTALCGHAGFLCCFEVIFNVQLKDESSDSTSIEQLEALHDRIKHLQKSVDDAEYKHQMAARQWRRGECTEDDSRYHRWSIGCCNV